MTKKFKKDNLRKAFDRALPRVGTGKATATEVSAGFIKEIDGDRQVFVKVAVFDKKLLKEPPETGGLLENQ